MTDIFEVKSSAMRDTGRKRKVNEDFTAYYEPADIHTLQQFGCLYIVADGVGGASHGELASQYAAEQILREYYRHPEIVEPTLRLRQAIWQANQDIYEYAESQMKHMATTVVAALVIRDQLFVANIGDSRAYLFRNGRVLQITTDHTISGQMYKDGLLTEEEAFNFKGKNKLDRALGVDEEVRIDFLEAITLQPGDKILLCSDGLTKYARTIDITQMIAPGTPEEISQRLIDFSNQRGGIDNISVILVDIVRPINLARLAAMQARGRLPEQVDWDTLITQPAIPPRYRWWAELLYLGQQHKKPFIFGLIGVVAILLIGTIYELQQLNKENPNGSPTATLFAQIDIPTSPPTVKPVEYTKTPLPTVQIEPTYQANLPTTPVDIDTFSPAVINSPEPILSAEPVPSQQVSATEDLIDCGIQITEQQGINYYLAKFNKVYDPNDYYYVYFYCNAKDMNVDCETGYRNTIHGDKNPILNINAWLIVPEIERYLCISQGGSPLHQE